MKNQKAIQETDFAEFALCPLRLSGDVQYPLKPELRVALATWKWLASAAYERRLPDLREVRTQYERISWNLLKDLAQAGQQSFRRYSVSYGARICRRLSDLAVRMMIEQPVTRYSLSFGRNRVVGDYAVVSRPRKPQPVYIVRLHLRPPKVFHSFQVRQPDITNMTRWLHFRFFDEAPVVRVLNWVLDRDLFWLDSFVEQPVHHMLNSLASNIADERRFPSPGAHCKNCQTLACQRALKTTGKKGNAEKSDPPAELASIDRRPSGEASG